ncbi:MAG: aldehyde ferredoxin oxidoreductase N-terminal domain-containing protein [Anaerolineales bacterium]
MAEFLKDPLTKVLFIDLNKLSYHIEERPELFEDYLGGTGVGIQLLSEYCPAGADPLGPENPIIFAVGPLVGHYPLASKTAALFKSPHTGNLGESHAGGRSAVALRMAGYGAVVIRGRSKLPVYLVITSDGVVFRDASAFWGMRSSSSVGSVLRMREEGSGLRSIMRIGRAGECQVSYANVTTETYRHFGRLGLGAVFGSKNLKALVVSGKHSLPVADKRAFRRIYDEIFREVTQTELMKKYHELGTAMNVNPLNQIGGLPTRNLTSGRFEGAEQISGERLREDYLGRRVACAHCPAACIHLAALRIPYPHDPYFYKTLMLGYDHELIYSMGSMLGIDDVPGMLQVIDEAELQGLDVMSTGVILAWATEALQRKLISTKETDGISLQWGQASGYISAIKRIVSQPTEFYRHLARGVDQAASVYGGEEFALSFGGNEMPGYHTGPGAHLGYLSGSRHSHLDSAGYSLDQKSLKNDQPLTAEGLAENLLNEESRISVRPWRRSGENIPRRISKESGRRSCMRNMPLSAGKVLIWKVSAFQAGFWKHPPQQE